MSEPGSTRVVWEQAGPIGHLTLRSEDGANRIDAATIDELSSACTALAEAGDLRAVVLKGTGSAFSLGWSHAALQELVTASAAAVRPDPFGCVAALPMPVIAAVDGDAVSAGLELALCCDIRVASRRARFALPETEFGLLPLAGGTQRLPRLIGRGRAVAMVLLGETVDAATAYAWGLVNRLTDTDPLQEAVQIAELIARRGPVAERFAKEALREGVEIPLERALRYELDLTVLLQTTKDRAEGVRAFTEKRSPRFLGL